MAGLFLLAIRSPATAGLFDLSESFSKRTSEGRAPASELVLQRGSLPSEIALQGGSLESKMVYRGVGAECGLRKTETYFRLIMKRVPKNVEKSGFQKNFLISPAHSCSWTF